MDWYLPGTKAGGPVRSIYSLVSCLKNYFDFYIITTNSDLGETTTYPNVEINTLFQKEDVNYYYFSKEHLNSENLLILLEEIKPDLIYLNSFWSVNFSINIVRLKNQEKISAPLLLAPRGMLGKGALGLKALKKGTFLFLAKIMGWYERIPFHATQAQEKEDILNKFSTAKVLIAPNVNSGSIVENKSIKERNGLRLFYLSRIAKVKNLHFALEVLKSVPPAIKIEYDIFGNLEDTGYWETCKEIISQLGSHVTVTYKGELKFNEVQNVISGYNCLFLPTLNENFGHSIVESLLCGCPVLISDQTPWNDLDLNGAGYALALNEKKKFVEAIVHCADLSQEQFSDMSKKAISYISKKIDLDLISSQYKILFNESIKN